MRRVNNQDSVSITPSTGERAGAAGAFLMVADGMGAHAAGELASRMATDCVPQAFLKSRLSTPAGLRHAVREANRKIHEKGSSAAEFRGMGTTCSCLALSEDSAMVAHVGDSRVYRLRDGVIEQLTFDHSLVWEMAAASNVSEDRVPSCIPKNVITRSLGPHETVNVDLEGPHELRHGDAFLLCSDGLTGVVEDALSGSLIQELEPDEAAQTLVDVANLRGGPDNVSVVVTKVEQHGAKPRPPAAASIGYAPLAALVAAIAFLAFAWALATNQQEALIGAALICASAAAVAVSKAGARHEPAERRTTGGPYGNGPYRRVDCYTPAESAGVMRELVEQLAAVCRAGDGPPTPGESQIVGVAPSFDWSPIAPLQDAAASALDSSDGHGALRRYADLLRELMQRLREDDGTHRYRAAPAEATD